MRIPKDYTGIRLKIFPHQEIYFVQNPNICIETVPFTREEVVTLANGILKNPGVY